jgi:hypothetical protein
MPLTKVDGFPVVIREWPRNSRGDLARIAIDRYEGRFIIDLRSWWRDSEGVLRPSRDGLSLSIEHLAKLADGVRAALRRAEEFGLLERKAWDGNPR